MLTATNLRFFQFHVIRIFQIDRVSFVGIDVYLQLDGVSRAKLGKGILAKELLFNILNDWAD